MSKGNTTENEFIKIAFRNATNDPSWRTQGNLYVALHTSDPGEAGDQTTNEVTTGAYASYARVAVPKDASGWDISGAGAGNIASNAAIISFPQCTGGTGATITHWSVGLVGSGASQILYSAILNAPLDVSNLIQPQFAAGELTITED